MGRAGRFAWRKRSGGEQRADAHGMVVSRAASAIRPYWTWLSSVGARSCASSRAGHHWSVRFVVVITTRLTRRDAAPSTPRPTSLHKSPGQGHRRRPHVQLRAQMKKEKAIVPAKFSYQGQASPSSISLTLHKVRKMIPELTGRRNVTTFQGCETVSKNSIFTELYSCNFPPEILLILRCRRKEN